LTDLCYRRVRKFGNQVCDSQGFYYSGWPRANPTIFLVYSYNASVEVG
jgi:hypothetical protein